MPVRSLVTRYAVVTILAVTALVHGAYFLASDLRTTSDSISYVAPARHLLAGDGYRGADGAPETARTPLYPLLLSVLFGLGFGPAGVVLFQHLLAIVISLGVYAVASRFLRDRALAFAAALLCGCDPALTMMSNQVMTELLFTLLLFTGFWLALGMMRGEKTPRSALRPLLLGMVVGLATLTRPIALLLFVPVAFWLLAFEKRRRWRTAVLFVVASLLLPAAWIYRNERATGIATLSSIDGLSMLKWRAAGAVAMEETGFVYTPFRTGGEDLYRTRTFRIEAPRLTRAADADFVRLGGDVTNRDALLHHYLRYGAAVLLAHPRGYFQSAANGALHMMLGGGFDVAGFLGGLDLDAAETMLYALAAVTAVLALIGSVALFRAHPPLFWLSASFISYFIVMSAGPESNFCAARFRAPIVPEYSLLAAAGIMSALRRMSRPHGNGDGAVVTDELSRSGRE